MKYEFFPIVINCPACQNNKGRRLYQVTASEAAQHFILRKSDQSRNERLKKHIQSLWKSNVCSVVQCNKCGVCFASPFVAGDKKFYSLAYDRSRYPNWKWEFEKTLSQLVVLKNDLFQNRKMRLLEIGAGDGSFLKKVVPNLIGFQDVFCTEYSDYGQKSIRKIGVKCSDENILTLDINIFDHRFDVICMFQVLEHIECLDETIDRLIKISNPHAHFFFAVPNNFYIKFLEENGALLDMPPNHLSRWTKDGFVSLAGRHNMKVVNYAVQQNENKFSLFWIFAKFYFLKKSQSPYTLASIVSSKIKTFILKRWLQGFVAILYALLCPRVYLKLAKTSFAPSQWVHLEKTIQTKKHLQ